MLRGSPKERALARLAEIEKLEAELGEEKRELLLFIKMYDRFEAPFTGADVLAANRDDDVDERPFATKEEIAQTVREILRGETEPMHIGFLYKKVTERGLRITGQSPKGNLSAKLAPFDDIIYVRDKGWILKENLSRRVTEADDE